MTSRLYYTDPACRDFDAVVTRSIEHDGRPALVLDRTAFYPTSGGQPFDTGTLGPAHVLDVLDVDDEVVHVVDRDVGVGTAVRGSIDWARRFDHMQQHTGQHLLSAAFEHAFGNRTIGFHMGADLSTIDLEREVSWSDIDRAVDSANQVVWEDRPVAIRFVSDQEAATLPLRKPPTRGGTLRLIDVSGFDLSACGGTHVARTGAIGLIAVTAAERFKGGSRITFVCGSRALQALRVLRDAVAGSVRVLSVLPAELPAAIDRLQQEGKDLRKLTMKLQEQVAIHEADRLSIQADVHDGVRRVIEIVEGFEPPALTVMASALAGKGQTIAALVSATTPSLVVIARSADVSGDANAWLRSLVGEFGGKGGGRPELAQGGGLNADPQTIVASLRRVIA